MILAPSLLWMRGRKDISARALAAVVFYYIIATYFVDYVLHLGNAWVKSAGLTALLGTPVLVIYRDLLLRVLGSLGTSFLLMTLLFHWYSIDRPYIPPATPRASRTILPTSLLRWRC